MRLGRETLSVWDIYKIFFKSFCNFNIMGQDFIISAKVLLERILTLSEIFVFIIFQETKLPLRITQETSQFK